MQNGRIPNTAITASSQLMTGLAPYLARLNLKKMGRKYGAWIPQRRTYNEWLQVSGVVITADFFLSLSH